MSSTTPARCIAAAVAALGAPTALAHDGHGAYTHVHLHLGNYVSLQWLVVAGIAVIAVGAVAALLGRPRATEARAAIPTDSRREQKGSDRSRL